MLMKSVMGWALRWSPRKEVEVAAVIDIISFLKYLFVYLVASGLRCSTQDLCCVLWELPTFHVAAHGLASCGSRVSAVSTCGFSCYPACGILFSRLGIQLVSPALQGGFLTTGPRGKS